MRFVSAAAIALAALQASPRGDLARMIAAERAFAAATRELGVRDGFLTFVMDDAIDVAPVGATLGLVNVKERLRSQPPAALPLARQLLWEPRWGAISSAGDLGWLTGPYRMKDAKGADPDRHGAYFSVWKRQPDGTYKVRLDIGIATARQVVFPEGFTPAPVPVAAPAAGPLVDSDLRMIEARFAEAASKNLAAAYRTHLLPEARLHRNERSPFAGGDAAAGFMASAFDRMAWSVLHVEGSASGDMAVAVGAYDAAAKASEGRPGSPERGYFVRVWHRDATGNWRIAFETNGIR